jgi:ribonuclease P protein subunit RPR2
MRKRKEVIRELARERIERLFVLAGEESRKEYITLARKIGMKYRVRIPKELKMRMCRNCYSYLIFGRNARVRLRGDRMSVTCLNCGKVMRRGY